MVRLKFIFFFTALLAPCTLVSTLRAQINEGVLLGTQPLSSDARGAAMGGNLISAADGIDALDYNPAALVEISSREFIISGFNREYNSNASFLGSPSTSQFDVGAISSIGFASPFPTVQGHFASAVSFDRVRDYTSAYSFSNVNPSSSYFNTTGFLTGNGSLPLHSQGGYSSNQKFLQNNSFAYALGLTYDVPDSGAFTIAAPNYAGMLQSGNVTTEGGLNAVRIGGGVDIAPTLSLGVTANILFGTYDFMENYSETNVQNIVTDTGTAAPAGFQSATISTHLHQDQSGGSLKFGFLADEKIFRLGVTVETPQVLHIDESSTQSGIADFQDVGPYAAVSPIYTQSYDIVTPWKFGVGGSVHLLGLTAQASASYINMADLQFTNSTFDMSALNTYASDSLRGVLSYSLGAEYKFLGISLRAGYSFEASPYKGDPTNYGITAISGGLGFSLTKYVDLEAAIRYSTYHTNHSIYNDVTPDGTPISASVNDDAVSRDDMSLTFRYRY